MVLQPILLACRNGISKVLRELVEDMSRFNPNSEIIKISSIAELRDTVDFEDYALVAVFETFKRQTTQEANMMRVCDVKRHITLNCVLDAVRVMSDRAFLGNAVLHSRARICIDSTLLDSGCYSEVTYAKMLAVLFDIDCREVLYKGDLDRVITMVKFDDRIYFRHYSIKEKKKERSLEEVGPSFATKCVHATDGIFDGKIVYESKDDVARKLTFEAVRSQAKKEKRNKKTGIPKIPHFLENSSSGRSLAFLTK